MTVEVHVHIGSDPRLAHGTRLGPQPAPAPPRGPMLAAEDAARARVAPKKSKMEVNYRHGLGVDKCAICVHGRFSKDDLAEQNGLCELVDGVIRRSGLCDLFESKSKGPGGPLDL